MTDGEVMSKFVIVNVNLQIPVPDDCNDDEAQMIAADYELPHEYVEDSYEFVNIVED